MRIVFTALCPWPSERLRANEDYARSLGFPRKGVAGHRRLAIVGGSPDLADKIEAIRCFDGDVWAVNGAYRYLKDRGIEATFYSIDAAPAIGGMCQGARKAIVALYCDPSVFDALREADVCTISLSEIAHVTGSSSAATGIPVGIDMGYREITFFGCASCYGERTHAYDTPPPKSLLKIACDGQEFVASPGILMQAEYISELIRAAPHLFKEESGGLLRAMVNDPDYDIIAASQSIHDELRLL